MKKKLIETEEIQCNNCGWKGKIAQLGYDIYEKKYKYICPNCNAKGELKQRK